jgi:hypothetical protein
MDEVRRSEKVSLHQLSEDQLPFLQLALVAIAKSLIQQPFRDPLILQRTIKSLPP